jgi:D-aspartate ligase
LDRSIRPGTYRREQVPNPPALVIGGQLNGLSVCRSLAQAGIETYVLDTRWYYPASWSRSATSIKAKTLHGPGLLDTLRTVSLPEGTVLIITDEMAVYTISEYRDELAGKFRFHLPSHEMVLIQHDKALFHKFAIASGLPVPNAIIIGDDGEISKIRDLRFPVVIKPADKQDFHLKGVSRIVLGRNPEQAMIACQKLLTATSEVIVQECIEGHDSNIYFSLFYRKDDTTKAIFTGQKLASVPRGTGSTGLCVEFPQGNMRTTLEDLTETFLVRSNYAGIGGIEYKWDSRTERFLIIEPTVGRTDWQEEIATLSGINIPAITYYEECNLPVPSSKHTPGVVWQQSYIDRIRSGFGIVPPNSTVVDGYWRRDDPVPALIYYPWGMLRLIQGPLRWVVKKCGG